MAAHQQHQMVDIKLNSPRTPEQHQQMPPQFNRPTTGAEGAQPISVRSWISKIDDPKPSVRFYAIGPRSKHIFCPLCKERSDTTTARVSTACDDLNCVLSCLSCCFPIFALSFLYTCFQNQFKTKRKFCNKCGGCLGFYLRPQ